MHNVSVHEGSAAPRGGPHPDPAEMSCSRDALRRPETPTYDDDGNMLTNGDWSYSWNTENRLIAAESATAKLEFAYDYLGRRTTKKVYAKSGDAWTLQTMKHFVYDGFKQIAELTDNAVTMYTV